jgi:hypothetical protein
MKTRLIPMYLVSPQLFVTREHIISASASSSLSPLASLGGSGEAVPLRGLGRPGCTGVAVAFCVVCAEDDGLSSVEALSPGVPACSCLSASLLSNVAKSVLPSSSSGSTPDRRINDSIRARRFSRPSIYFALGQVSAEGGGIRRIWVTDPFGGCLFFSTCVNIHSVL